MIAGRPRERAGPEIDRATNGSEPGNVILATHYWSPGWASALDDYLIPRARKYRWIGHPLFADGSPSTFREYTDGELVKSVDVAGPRGPLRHLEDLLRTLRWARQDKPADLFIAGDNLLALAGIWMRWRRRVRAVVLYTIDFVPQRFKNPLANRIYHSIDRFAAERSDVVWNTAKGVIAARVERDEGRKLAPHIVVPIGAYTHRTGAAADGSRRRTIAYLGHLLEKQGLQVVISALPEVRRRFPEAQLLVIGDGPYRPALEKLAQEVGVSDAVEFAGFSDDHVAIERRLLECTIGVAPYVPDQENYSRFQDLPGKIINYLACGLAVITTEVPGDGSLIVEAGAGRVVDYAPASFAAAINDYFQFPALLDSASSAAMKLGAAYDWTEIFDRAFSETHALLHVGH
jgi:glycosyltransferase involved in cell wall biosynthesis